MQRRNLFLIVPVFFLFSCELMSVGKLEGTWKLNLFGTTYYQFNADKTYKIQTNLENTEATFSEGTYTLSKNILRIYDNENGETNYFKAELDGDILQLTTLSGISLTVNLIKVEYNYLNFYRYPYKFVNNTNESIVISPSTDALWSSFTIDKHSTHYLYLWKIYSWYFSYPAKFTCDQSTGDIVFTLYNKT